MNSYNNRAGNSKKKTTKLEAPSASNYRTVAKAANDETDDNSAGDQKNEIDRNKVGRVFTGSVERVMKWHRIYPHFCYYEVIASVIALQETPVRMQRMMLLRDRKGPILQVAYYSYDRINIADFFVGQTLRCIGHMVASSTLHALSIRAATDEELSTLQRMAYICDHAVASAIS